MSKEAKARIKINKLLEEVIEENEITKSTLIENLLIQYFNNKK